MTTQTKSRGFTIVELLIVIVVIAILAAITIVAYNGITKNANSSAAKSNADSVRAYANAYQADPANTAGDYPALSSGALESFANGIAKLPAGITFSTDVPTSAFTKTTVAYDTTTNDLGACIGVWDPGANNGNGQALWLYVGNASGTAPSSAPISCA